LEELTQEYEGQIQVAKMNVDENPATPSKYGVRAIPTLILFKDGDVVGQVTGAVSKSNLKDMINQKAL
jgi:thioredoxin 1